MDVGTALSTVSAHDEETGFISDFVLSRGVMHLSISSFCAHTHLHVTSRSVRIKVTSLICDVILPL